MTTDFRSDIRDAFDQPARVRVQGRAESVIRPAGARAAARRRLMVRATWLVAAALAVFGLTARPARADSSAPDAFVQKISADVLDKIKADKDIQAGNPKKLSDLVDSTIMPVVNFERMTALAVGRSWRQASPEQQKELMAQFRILLLRTYSGALQNVGDQQIRMKPFRGDPKDSDVVVRSEVVAKQGDPIQLDYRLEKAGDSWKIYDLNVLGVWLVDNYRNQFQQEISAKGIDGLIQSLTDKNKQFAAKT